MLKVADRLEANLELLATAENIRQFIKNKNISGIEELKLDVEQGKPELPIIIDRQKARRLNVSTGQIGDALRTSLFGKEISTFKDGEDDSKAKAIRAEVHQLTAKFPVYPEPKN